MEKTAVSGVSTLNGNFYQTQVIDNGNGTFSSTLFRTDAQGNNPVPIAGYSADSGGNAVVANTDNATPEEQQLIADPNSSLNQLRKTQTRTLESEFFGQGNPQAPNPDEQGGSTPATPTPTGTAPASTMFKYPLKMDDGQDKIKFVPLTLKKVDLASGGQISVKRPTYEKAKDSTPIFIGIQGSISDSNAVSWGSGELNKFQEELVNLSLRTMSEGMSAVTKAIDSFQNKITDKPFVNQLKGLGQLYLAEQATGTAGLQSRISGSVLNPNLELLFQGPELRTFQFQFKMSPRSKDEADIVKKIIKEFKRNMAVKNEGLFLKAPNVFKIQYLKGMEVHQSINLIKVCALLNFAVDYTPNGSYMTFGGGENGDPEASMVTYNLSMTFQEIEPIYQNDYTKFDYGDGEQTIDNHQIGA